MSKIKGLRSGKTSIRLCLLVFAIIVAAAVWMRPSMVSSQSNGPGEITAKKPIQNFDIRNNSSDDANNFQQTKSLALGQRSDTRTALRQQMKAAGDRLKAANPGVNISWNDEIGAPEVVRTLSSNRKLTPSSGNSREQVLRGFMSQNADLYGLTKAQVAQLHKTADYQN